MLIDFFSTYCNPSDIAFEMIAWVFGSEMVVFDVHDIADLAMDLLEQSSSMEDYASGIVRGGN